jgi:hypothetical protein
VVVGFDIEDVPTIVAARDLDESSTRQSRRPSLAAEESEIDRDYVHQGSAVVRQGCLTALSSPRSRLIKVETNIPHISDPVQISHQLILLLSVL